MVVADQLPISLISGISCSLTLVWVCITDLRERLIPNRSLIAGSVPVLIAFAAVSPDLLPGRFLWAAIVAFPFGLVSWFRPDSMGMGDAKLIAFLGLCLGPAVVAAVIWALLAGGAVAALLFARHGPAARKVTIPFAPCLALGAVAGAFEAGWVSQLTHLTGS